MTQYNANDPRRTPQTSAPAPLGVYPAPTAAPARRGSRTGLKLTIFAALIAAASFLGFKGGLFGTIGKGTGNDANSKFDPTVSTRPPNSIVPTTTEATAVTLSRPLEVVIDGDKYSVDDKPKVLAEVLTMAKLVPPGKGPAVEIRRKPTSLLKAESDLQDALDAAKVPFYLVNPPDAK